MYSVSFLEPLLLLWGLYRFGCLLLTKELVRRVVVSDIPKVLGHGNDETSNNENGQDGRVLAWKWRKWALCMRETIVQQNTDPETRIDTASSSLSLRRNQVLTLVGLGLLGRLESRASVITLLDKIDFVLAVQALTDNPFRHHVARGENGSVDCIGRRSSRQDTASNGKGGKGSSSSLFEINNLLLGCRVCAYRRDKGTCEKKTLSAKPQATTPDS